MAEKDANNSHNAYNDSNDTDAAGASRKGSCELPSGTNEQSKETENDSYDLDPYLSSYESAKREENPFSFKKFLNQDSSSQKDKGARKKVYATGMSSSKSEVLDHSLSRSQQDTSARVIGSADVSSVLPDFVQDHLVIEQCYLNGNSAINIDNLNLQNLPDLNLEHQNIHFTVNSERDLNHLNQSHSHYSNNLPDFTLGGRNFQSATHNHCNSDGLPDFALNAGVNVDCANDGNNSFINKTRRRNNEHESSEPSHSGRSRGQMSSSPSVPLDLPSYDNNSESNQNMSMPFDLTAPAEDQNNCGNRCAGAPETVSKSLPDFLSDGPIKKELDENFKSGRGNPLSVPNGLQFPEPPTRMDIERLVREVDMLRCQLSEKNRRLSRLESELEHLHSTDQRETASLEYAFREVENNLKQTTKRALHAEDMVYKLKQENKSLKSEICSLRSENMQLRLGEGTSDSLTGNRSQQIANELRTAASIAESSLRSLLGGVKNLRVLASSIENTCTFQDADLDYQDSLQEDAASGPAL